MTPTPAASPPERFSNLRAMEGGATDPILVVGISRRSGTNFLASLLTQHPDCAAPAAPLREDHLLRDAPLLLDYARRTSERWPLRWGDRDDARTRLERHLGEGIAAFLADGSSAPRVVSKTPSPEHLSSYPHLLPNAYVIVLLRDGRSTVESLVRGFRWSFAKAADEWRRGARAILEFQRDVASNGTAASLRCRVVRYEDVVADPVATVRDLLEFCGLDPQRYDFDAARNAPVIGSSFVRDAHGELTWTPVDRAAAFQPTERFANWRPVHHARFEHLAGEYQRALGYDTVATDADAWRGYNRAADLARPIVGLRDDLTARYFMYKRARHQS
jgi:hypothetical protein